MIDTLLSHEGPIRLTVFIGLLALMAVWEFAAPRRRAGLPRVVRWSNNLMLVFIDSAIVRLVFPILAVGMASLAEERGWGLFNTTGLPGWLEVVFAFLILDFAIYLQHVLFHAVPGLWRLHRVHHADTDFDVTTGVRFHPIEILLSMALKLAIVVALGAPPVAVLLFELVLSATALFNHGNVDLPERLDRMLRLFVVTPDMHRVHHSVHVRETNSNFGFNLPWWDRLLGTYRAQPRDGHGSMTIGIEEFRTPRDHWLDRLLLQPLRGGPGRYPIGRREGE